MAKRRRSLRGKAKTVTLLSAAVGALAILVGIQWVDHEWTNSLQHHQCGMVMAESALMKDGTWALFSLETIPVGHAVADGDPVIVFFDIFQQFVQDVMLLIARYAWSGADEFEGYYVFSVPASVGSLGTYYPPKANVELANVEKSHEGETRVESPAAGAFTHYFRRYTAKRTIHAGDELVVPYQTSWSQAEILSAASSRMVEHPRKSVKELRETGICVDNIRAGPSTIPHAGKGAFATRALQQGTIVAPSPLIPIVNREALSTRQVERSGKSRNIVEGRHLLLNYCFGHANSSLLFVPYGPGVSLINHSSQHPNVEIRWSQSNLHYGLDMLDWPIDKVKELNRTVFLLEVVATQNIAAGDEILMNYGDEWEDAWKAHVRNWVPVDHADEFVYDHEFEQQIQGHLRLDAFSDVLTKPEINDLQVGCVFHYRERAQDKVDSNGTLEWKSTEHTRHVENLRPCSLVSIDSDGTYTAEMLNFRPDHPDAAPNGTYVTKIPRGAIFIRNRQYTSDQHLANGFRHDIQIPTEIFPKQWMDLSK